MNAFIVSRLTGQWTIDLERLRKTHPALDKDYEAVFEIKLLSRVLETLILGAKTDVDKDDKMTIEYREDLVQSVKYLGALLEDAVIAPIALGSLKTERNP